MSACPVAYRSARGKSSPPWPQPLLDAAMGATPAPGLSLSLLLRAKTAAAHRAVELAAGIPDQIESRERLVSYLQQSLRLYRPLETMLARYGAWAHWALDLRQRSHTGPLAQALAGLGAGQPLADASDGALPHLPTFAHALGALYVLEGSTLGGQLILRGLRAKGIDGAEEAGLFFASRGGRTGPLWRSFKATLDRYGESDPGGAEAVLEGAARTFRSIGTWFREWRESLG